MVTAAVCSALLLLSPPAADATLILVGDGELGDFVVQLHYSASSATTATLVIELTNTSASELESVLTAFLLYNPDNLVESAVLASSTGALGTLRLSDRLPFFGAVSSPGGITTPLQPGGSVTLTFFLSGSNLDTLDEWSFVNPPGPASASSSVFRERLGSDGLPRARFRAPGNRGERVQAHSVPEPGLLVFLGAGLIAILGLVWWRRSHDRKLAAPP